MGVLVKLFGLAQAVNKTIKIQILDFVIHIFSARDYGTSSQFTQGLEAPRFHSVKFAFVRRARVFTAGFGMFISFMGYYLSLF